MKQDSLKGAVAGVMQIVTNVGLLMVLVPVFIDRLGIEAYGVYAVIMALGNLGTFTNFGFNTSLIKYLVEQERGEESNADIWVTFSVIGGAATLAVCLLLVGEATVLGFVLPSDQGVSHESIHIFYMTAIIASGFQVFAQVPAAVLDSCRKVYITNGVQIASGSLGKLAMIISLVLAPGLENLGWILLVSSATGLGLMAAFARRSWGPVASPGFWRSFLPIARKHFRYSRAIYGSSLISYFYEPATKLLVSRYIGIAEVGYLDIALRVKSLGWSILERMLYPVLPLIASKTEEGSRVIIEEVQQKVMLIIVPLIVMTIFFTGPVITLWLGSEMGPVVRSTMIIVSAYFLALVFVPLYQFLSVKGHPEKTLVLQSINAVVNLTLFALLVPLFGLDGAVLAFTSALLASTSMCAWYQWRILHSSPFRERKSITVLIKLTGALFVLNAVLQVLHPMSVATLMVGLAVNGTATVMFLRWFRAFDHGDIVRYFGEDTRLARIIDRIFIPEFR